MEYKLPTIFASSGPAARKRAGYSSILRRILNGTCEISQLLENKNPRNTSGFIMVDYADAWRFFFLSRGGNPHELSSSLGYKGVYPDSLQVKPPRCLWPVRNLHKHSLYPQQAIKLSVECS